MVLSPPAATERPAAHVRPPPAGTGGVRVLLLTAAVLWLVVLAAVSGASLSPAVAAVLVLALVLALGDAAVEALRLRVADPVARVVVAAGLGTVALLVVGLLVDLLLPVVGVSRPLAPVPVSVGLLVAGAALHLAAPLPSRRRRVAAPVPSPGAVLAVAGLLVLPVAGASGATALSNGRSSALTVVLLVVVLLGMAGISLVPRLPSRAWRALAVYCASLGLLLMTSMRGPHITGHDIQLEHLVAQLAVDAQRWDISALRVDYNACLSITVLPAVVVALTHVSTDVVLQLVLQVLFALTPVAVMLIAEASVGARQGLAAAALFVAFPTFFTDMMMLVRQEVALLCVAALALLVARKHDDLGPSGLRRRQAAVVLLGVGTVLSHYSTTYLLIAQLGVAAGIGTLLALWVRRRPGTVLRPPAHRVVTLPVVLVIAGAALVWASSTTGGGSSFVGVARQAFGIVGGTASVDDVSDDASASIFGGGTPLTDQQRVDDAVSAAIELAPPEQRRALQELAVDVPVTAASEATVPLTGLGRLLDAVGLDVFDTTATVRQLSAYALQVLVSLGTLVVARRALGDRHERELVLLALGAVALLALFVVLPFLTADYGLLRLFQQGLVVLAVPGVVGATALTAVALRTGRRLVRAVVPVKPPCPAGDDCPHHRVHRVIGPARTAALVPVLLFASSSGLAAWATGGYYAPLHLANAGSYYDDYYLPASDLAMMRWVAAQPRVAAHPEQAAQADLWTGLRTWSQTGERPRLGILPVELGENTFVELSRPNVVLDEATGGVQNLGITYRYPTDHLERTKDRVYDNGAARVYR